MQQLSSSFDKDLTALQLINSAFLLSVFNKVLKFCTQVNVESNTLIFT